MNLDEIRYNMGAVPSEIPQHKLDRLTELADRVQDELGISSISPGTWKPGTTMEQRVDGFILLFEGLLDGSFLRNARPYVDTVEETYLPID